MDKKKLEEFRQILTKERERLLKDVQRNDKAIRHADGDIILLMDGDGTAAASAGESVQH